MKKFISFFIYINKKFKNFNKAKYYNHNQGFIFFN